MNSAQHAGLIILALEEYAAARKREAGSHRWAGPSHAGHRETLRRQARDADRLAASITVPAEGTVRLHLDFAVGTLTEIGLGGLQVPWIDATQEGTRYDVTCGAGVGNGFLNVGAVRGSTGQYARASITDLAQTMFGILERRLDAAADEAARQAVEEATPQ